MFCFWSVWYMTSQLPSWLGSNSFKLDLCGFCSCSNKTHLWLALKLLLKYHSRQQTSSSIPCSDHLDIELCVKVFLAIKNCCMSYEWEPPACIVGTGYVDTPMATGWYQYNRGKIGAMVMVVLVGTMWGKCWSGVSMKALPGCTSCNHLFWDNCTSRGGGGGNLTQCYFSSSQLHSTVNCSLHSMQNVKQCKLSYTYFTTLCKT